MTQCKSGETEKSLSFQSECLRLLKSWQGRNASRKEHVKYVFQFSPTALFSHIFSSDRIFFKIYAPNSLDLVVDLNGAECSINRCLIFPSSHSWSPPVNIDDHIFKSRRKYNIQMTWSEVFGNLLWSWTTIAANQTLNATVLQKSKTIV